MDRRRFLTNGVMLPAAAFAVSSSAAASPDGPSRKFGGAELLSFVKRMYLGRSAAGIGSNPLAVAGCQVSDRT